MDYPWPGNVRELENAVERAVVISQEHELTDKDFTFLQAAKVPLPDISSKNLQEIERHHIVRILNENHWNISKSATELGMIG